MQVKFDNYTNILSMFDKLETLTQEYIELTEITDDLIYIKKLKKNLNLLLSPD